ncbi:MAG: PLD nuclease N-terminal domain-containing protein [Micromonosporaceae bacterium]
MGRLLLLLLLVHLVLAFAAIVDCLGGERRPQRLSRFTWTLLILFGLLAGPVCWFLYGRPGRKLALPWRLPGPPPHPPRQVAPDDDPEFLADLERRRRATRSEKPDAGKDTDEPNNT